ncbi:BMP family ABC transporter substrate-binding protein [Bradyrhizobium sp. 31Argb]|uniref:BMP family ABC transporter substrate-binding protein n=1 Tax=Bradyrhizobium sp. 31Argb TaxID=3141247 RepID=UPI003749F1D9
MSDLRHLSRRRFLNLGAAAGSSLLLPPGLIRSARAAAPLPAVAEKDAVIAFGHTGPVTDEGWTWSHDQGMKAVKAAFPQVKTVFVESIPYSADATRTYRQFVSENACMVFATSNYADFLYDVAKRSPKVAFYECDGRNPLDNLSTYYVAHWYPTYVTGVAAGLMSKSGKLGYVASFPVPSVFSGTNAFLMGARSVNPNATMQVITINSWFDPQAATPSRHRAARQWLRPPVRHHGRGRISAGRREARRQGGDVEHGYPPLRAEGLHQLDRHRLQAILCR